VGTGGVRNPALPTVAMEAVTACCDCWPNATSTKAVRLSGAITSAKSCCPGRRSCAIVPYPCKLNINVAVSASAIANAPFSSVCPCETPSLFSMVTTDRPYPYESVTRPEACSCAIKATGHQIPIIKKILIYLFIIILRFGLGITTPVSEKYSPCRIHFVVWDNGTSGYPTRGSRTLPCGIRYRRLPAHIG